MARHTHVSKPKKPKTTVHKSTSTKKTTVKHPHVHSMVRSHRVRLVHSHISHPPAAKNPYQITVV